VSGLLDTRLTRDLGIALPVIGGAMYPCSNPELVAAVSQAGGIGVLQPVSLTYVHGHDFRDGLRYIRSLTDGPIGMNALLEGTSRIYRERMTRWIDGALEDGVRFFVTSLGKPDWVVRLAEQAGARVYHDVTERKWADKALDSGVHGLIAVNDRAGGHAGPKSAEALFDELAPLGLPLVCAGGIGDAAAFVRALRTGYDGVQIGTRLIATTECTASLAYKAAIIEAEEDDVVLTERVTGVPLAVIRTPYVDRVGTRAGWLARRLLRGRRTKNWMRSFYAVRSAIKLRRAAVRPNATPDYWQAGKSVAGIDSVESVAHVLGEFAAAAGLVRG
jgi:nitronate monooxygenase